METFKFETGIHFHKLNSESTAELTFDDRCGSMGLVHWSWGDQLTVTCLVCELGCYGHDVVNGHEVIKGLVHFTKSIGIGPPVTTKE
jgi:hypothetical protein